MKKRAFVIVLLLIGALAIRLFASPQVKLSRDPEVEAYIRGLVKTHPSPELRKNLGGWLQTGKVMVATSTNVPVLGSNLVHRLDQPEVKVPVIVANPNFPFTANTLRTEDVVLLKHIQIFHEYVHIKNHFSGKFVLGGTFKDKGTVSQQAKFFWDSEWDASVQHWAFARSQHAERLLDPATPKAGFANESLRLLEGFYQGLLSVYPSEQVSQYKPFWEKFYQQQKQKFLAIR